MSVLLALVSAAVASPSIVFQGDITGGVSVDGSGVSTPYSGSSAWFSGAGLRVQVPAGATITDAYLLLQAKWSGLPGSVASQVRVNGVTLASATAVSSGTRYATYRLNPAVFGLTGSGTYSYEETGAADSGYQSGVGVGGAVLAVLYTHPTLTGRRHVVIGADDVGFGTTTLTGLPTTGTMPTALVSVGILWECSDEQNGQVYAGSTLLTSVAGGRDDGATFTTDCSSQDWNSLTTMGSFGFSSADAWSGLDGDSPSTEPSGGSAINSRLSDELYSFSYANAGSLTLGYYDSTADSRLSTFAVVIERDTDNDGLADAADNCPSVSNPAQANADGDARGDACDTCTDVDADGFGAAGYAASTCATDCNDAASSIYPGAPDTWYDGVDADCAGNDDFDRDADGQRAASWGGTDCNDTNAAVYLGAPDTWYDGVDADCAGNDDFDRDADGVRHPSGGGADCDDAAAGTYPGAPDAWYDGVDADCAGNDDFDQDADGFRAPAGGGADCDDTNTTVYPGAPELTDGLDNDCDGNDELYDGDGDGLTDITEGTLGTDPARADTDGDGLSDGAEVSLGTDPRDDDTDADGLIDGEEVAATETDPLVADTDGDGLSDGDEVDATGTDPLAADTDGDGLSDGREVDELLTDPLAADTDGDGLSDGEEAETWGTDPLARDTDGGGVWDGVEVEIDGTDPLDGADDITDTRDSDGDGLRDKEELLLGTDRFVPDTDGDGLSDGVEVLDTTTDPLAADTDEDGLSDGVEVLDTATDPRSADTDGDGLSDGVEVLDTATDPLSADTDGDGLADGDELSGTFTDPRDADTDDGGVPDGEEWSRGTDPLDPADDLPVGPDTGGDSADPSPGGDADGLATGSGKFLGGGGCSSAPAGAVPAGALLVAGLTLLWGRRPRRPGSFEG